MGSSPSTEVTPVTVEKDPKIIENAEKRLDMIINTLSEKKPFQMNKYLPYTTVHLIKYSTQTI